MKPNRNTFSRHILKVVVSAAVVGLLLLALAGCKDFSFFNELGVKSGLALTPASVSILTGGTMGFSASGGNGSYVYSIISGCGGTIDPDTGVYNAPGSACSEVVMVTDSSSLSATATVNVVTTLTALEINPKVATLSPGSGITFVATGGTSPYTFSFQTDNSGGNITSGGAYTAGGVTGVSDTIIVTDDDSTVCAIPANVSVVAATSSVNYSVTADSFPAAADAGSALSGDFTVTNLGTGNGAKTVSWWLYLSEDGSFGGDGETLIASNSTGALNSGSNTVVTPTGDWPMLDGNYTVFVMVSAEDDMTHGDNIYEKTDWDIALTVPDVDYRVTSITNTGGNLAGEGISGVISVGNQGSDNGSSDFTWKVYVSSDTMINVGDTLIDSDTHSGLASGATQIPDPTFSGTWPSSPDNYYLIVEVSAADDEAAGNDGNNITASGSAYNVHYRDVDYQVVSVTHLSGTSAGGSVDGEFDLDNTGTDDGITSVDWKAYASTNAFIDAGDALIAEGTESAMDVIDPVQTIGFSATWPTAPGAYYLVVEVSASDDTQAGNQLNNETATGSTVGVVVADVDYYADAISAAPGDAGGSLTWDFDLNNGGGDDSASVVTWNLYVSSNNTLDAGDYLADFGPAGPLGAGSTSNPVNPPPATWPAVPGSYYLIVEIESLEDVAAGTTANDIAVSASTFMAAAPDVDYVLDQVNFVPAGSTYVPDGTVNGEFVYKNDGSSNGGQPVSWEAYASLNPTLAAGGATLIDSGSGLPALGTGANSGSIGFTGSWPLDYGDYYLLVRVMAGDEVNPGDNEGASAGQTAVGYYDETLSEPNDDWNNLTDYLDTGVTFTPGMSIHVIGSLENGGPNDLQDVIGFNTGTCTMITFALNWSTGSDDITIYVLSGPPPSSVIDGVGGTTDAISLNWTVDTPGVMRFANPEYSGGGGPKFVPYTMIITGH